MRAQLTVLPPACLQLSSEILQVTIQHDTPISPDLMCRWDEVMDVPDGAERDQVGIGQWSPNITFGDFTERTLQKYHPALPQADHVAQIV